jgi:putative transposase
MARIARFVIRDIPHPMTRRGNRREPVFFSDEDYAACLELLKPYAAQSKTEIWSVAGRPS